MLRSMELSGVGPAPKMGISFAERLNVVTGDNSLGKTFLLDVAWWALTRTWAGIPALPLGRHRASITYVIRGKKQDAAAVQSTFRADRQEWPGEAKRPAIPGVVVYARIDGGFSVWDPSRNYWRKDTPERPAAYHFDHGQIWSGLEVGGVQVCEGLERDWVSWQKGKEPQFASLVGALERLSPPELPLRPGSPRRVFLGEGYDRPTLRLGDEAVPIVLAPAGIRRVLALAYLLVWAWHEHRATATLLGKAPETRITLLIDEPETHLHPRWQRCIIPALMETLETLGGGSAGAIQVLVATHSPMVLASLEPIFQEEHDALFHLALVDRRVVLRQEAWAKQGDATNWLVSEVFGLEQARSAQAEHAIEAAEALMRGDMAALPAGLKTKSQIDATLRKLLPAHDDFWPRWIVTTGSAGVRTTHRRGEPR
ncbi:MAG: ATP-binding protein [Candidatus Riflebacteria bacterium]|nr:ATP-binding protein [Candidatus Riflebacteria bacterium]